MAEIEDKEWLELLAGKAVSSENTNQKRSADALRAAIKQYDAEELAQAHGLNKLMSRMTNEGLFFDPSDISMSKRIIRFIKKIRLLVIFIIGLTAGLMVPMQLATRGGADNSINLDFLKSSENKIDTEITITSKKPLQKAQKITISAISAGLTVTTLQHGDVIHLTIKGFKKMDPELIPINAVLGLSNQTQGNVSVLIKEE